MNRLIAELAPTKKISLTDKIHDQILELIIKSSSDEEIVLTEKRLMELLGVSKAPVREALIKLCSEGVLINVPRFGYRVIRMSEKDAHDVVQMRQLLELEALKQSFPTLSDVQLAEIRDQIKRATSKQNVDVWKVWEDNEEFHLLLASFSNNKILMKLLRDCMGIQQRVYAQQKWNLGSSMADSVVNEPHDAIYRRLVERDLPGAAELLGKDIVGVTEE